MQAGSYVSGKSISGGKLGRRVCRAMEGREKAQEVTDCSGGGPVHA
jgi:hypothetical protein